MPYVAEAPPPLDHGPLGPRPISLARTCPRSSPPRRGGEERISVRERPFELTIRPRRSRIPGMSAAAPSSTQPTPSGRCGNIAAHLPRMAAAVPDQPAVVVGRGASRTSSPRYAQLTFAELEALANRYANALVASGFEPRQRVLVMVRPGFDFIATIFALFKMGAVPVMIDPGMGVRRMLDCLRDVDIQGFVGIPAAHGLRAVRPDVFRSVRAMVTVGAIGLPGAPSLARSARRRDGRFDLAATKPSDPAAILFTSGSTGPAKGVVYEHGMFDAQVRMIQSCYGIQPGEVDLPAFPLFALFSTAMGMTSVIPPMDPSRPGRADPRRIVAALLDWKVTSTFGSPAVWRKVAAYAQETGVKIPSLRRVLVAGAPVPRTTIVGLHRMLSPEADVFTPYGATEALPVCSIGGRELLAECADKTRRGAGICVGRPLAEATVRVLPIDDRPISHWQDRACVSDGTIGEIVVAGPMVTRTYYGRPQADAVSKISEGDRVWHRMGDVGYFDEAGRLWFCGRKSQRVATPQGTLFPDQCEAIFNEHPQVRRCALVGVGPRDGQSAVLVVEPTRSRISLNAPGRKELIADLRHIASDHPMTGGVAHILFHRSLPVDVRHNAKIHRETLAEWAAKRVPVFP